MTHRLPLFALWLILTTPTIGSPQQSSGHATTSTAPHSESQPGPSRKVPTQPPLAAPAQPHASQTQPVAPSNTTPTATPALHSNTESIEVSAYRSPVSALESPANTRVLSSQTLEQAPAAGLDGKLRTVPGFDLFRRSSSLVANPTTEGVSLRGLGSTAASRTLVLFGDVPLNDPFGGWIHWEELPALAIGRIEVVRGGVSDLYGSSAMGGLVQITPIQIPPGSPSTSAPDSAPPTSGSNADLTLQSSYGGEAQNENNALLRATHNNFAILAASELLGTDGYTLVAPNLRGTVDRNSNVHAQNGLILLQHTSNSSANSQWLRGGVLNEDRHNGTVLTNNATRLWRYAAGLDQQALSSAWQLRAWGSSEHYRQNFSSVAVGRASETLTRNAFDPSSELGGAIRWSHTFTPSLIALAGGDARDIRAEDIELPTAPAAKSTTTTTRQTDGGGYGELLWTPGPWLLSASARLDRFVNRDAATYTLATGTRTPLPDIDQTIFDPRLGLSRRLGNFHSQQLAASASVFRAYRAPTPNELYRTGQVGQQTTLANPNLLAERSTGWEAGLTGQQSHASNGWQTSWRASYFWTEVNRPVTALTLNTTPTATTLMRENLGQIRSRGLQLDGSLHPAPWLSLTGGYQFARATVTQFSQQPTLVGKWIPQVPRNTATLQATATSNRLGLLSLQARTSGRQYDDDANTYILHPYTSFDIYASRSFARRWKAFASVENLLDRSIDVGRTPIRTLGTPQLARFGLQITLH
jgi:outer membrane receptor protein involved in Fe transport